MRVSFIFHVFASFCNAEISHQQQKLDWKTNCRTVNIQMNSGSLSNDLSIIQQSLIMNVSYEIGTSFPMTEDTKDVSLLIKIKYPLQK